MKKKKRQFTQIISICKVVSPQISVCDTGGKKGGLIKECVFNLLDERSGVA